MYAFGRYNPELYKSKKSESACFLVEYLFLNLINARVDCLTDKYAVEFDFANKWAESIGQALHYLRMTGKKAKVVLILEDPKKEMVYYHRVKELGRIHNFEVEYVTKNLLKLNDKGQCQYLDCKCHRRDKKEDKNSSTENE